MREILSCISRPSHYAGIEDGVSRKDPKRLTLHLALAFPDLYEVGMSYLGQKILYALVNAREQWWAERVMAPEPETGAYMKAHGVKLATLESDTELRCLDLIGFSITHELCYTNVLYMLDLAGIPLRSEQRSDDGLPLIIAGGGALLSAEPLTPFMDLMLLGDGEEAFPRLLEMLELAKKEGWKKSELLRRAMHLPGIYVPSLQLPFAKGPKPTRVIVADLNQTFYPTRQVVPVGAVHNRLSLEIARGCTRGCRFCQAGMVYRPVRERSISVIKRLLAKSLEETGFDEISFLALSSGDYSALKALSHSTLDMCRAHQITLSLPSQRVGSIDDEIIARMAGLRRTGMTLAPEAGSQRLRDVINKGISEEEILLHAQKLLEHGWRLVKLYFMIGLPTEDDSDLDAIVDLCCKVRDAAGRGNPRLQVTAALSPFVPKPFTPFQWAAQADMDDITRRVHRVRQAMKGKKGLSLRWHEPAQSHLEGILSRAGREMAEVVEKAYQNGAIFCSWMEHFSLEPWLRALDECGLDVKKAIGARDLQSELPWDHLEAGISKAFLMREWQKALKGEVSCDCRYAHCNGCGACDTSASPSLLRTETVSESLPYSNRLILDHRDQNAHKPHFDENGKLVLENCSKAPGVLPELTRKAVQYRIWHTKTDGSSYISQLELQSVLERAVRRANLPVAFSNGFHPLPLITFGRALPVGVESLVEWFSISFHEELSPSDCTQALAPRLCEGMQIVRIESVDKKSRSLLSVREHFQLTPAPEHFQAVAAAFVSFMEKESVPHSLETKKGPRQYDLRAFLTSLTLHTQSPAFLLFEADWSRQYLSPLRLVSAILGESDILTRMRLLKTAQIFEDSSRDIWADPSVEILVEG